MTLKMENVYQEASVKIERALLNQYQRRIMSGPSVRKAATIQLGLKKKNVLTVKDIINSGFGELDINKTYRR